MLNPDANFPKYFPHRTYWIYGVKPAATVSQPHSWDSSKWINLQGACTPVWVLSKGWSGLASWPLQPHTLHNGLLWIQTFPPGGSRGHVRLRKQTNFTYLGNFQDSWGLWFHSYRSREQPWVGWGEGRSDRPAGAGRQRPSCRKEILFQLLWASSTLRSPVCLGQAPHWCCF